MVSVTKRLLLHQNNPRISSSTVAGTHARLFIAAKLLDETPVQICTNKGSEFANSADLAMKHHNRTSLLTIGLIFSPVARRISHILTERTSPWPPPHGARTVHHNVKIRSRRIVKVQTGQYLVEIRNLWLQIVALSFWHPSRAKRKKNAENTALYGIIRYYTSLCAKTYYV